MIWNKYTTNSNLNIGRMNLLPLFLLSFSLTSLLFIGCGQKTVGDKSSETKSNDLASNPGSSNFATGSDKALGIAVIDLNRVAQEIGAQDKILISVARRETELRADLEQLTDTILEEIEPESNDVADLNKLTPELLDKLPMEQKRQYVTTAAQARKRILAYQQQLQTAFMNEVRPVAYEIAAKNGCEIVLTMSQVYVADSKIDITDSVVQRIQTLNANAKIPTPDKPKRIAKMPGGGEFPLR